MIVKGPLILSEKGAQKVCDAFNAENPVGTQVRYWRGERDGEPSGTGKTYTEASVLAYAFAKKRHSTSSGNTPVVWIEGCTGCIALTHVEVVK